MAFVHHPSRSNDWYANQFSGAPRDEQVDGQSLRTIELLKSAAMPEGSDRPRSSNAAALERTIPTGGGVHGSFMAVVVFFGSLPRMRVYNYLTRSSGFAASRSCRRSSWRDRLAFCLVKTLSRRRYVLSLSILPTTVLLLASAVSVNSATLPGTRPRAELGI